MLTCETFYRAAYRYWKANMVWLISQELETLTQENFRQERKRPAFLQGWRDGTEGRKKRDIEGSEESQRTRAIS
jgi:hypothetical protein